jgi:diguanylate cyclase (GGDEF)-like protein
MSSFSFPSMRAKADTAIDEADEPQPMDLLNPSGRLPVLKPEPEPTNRWGKVKNVKANESKPKKEKPAKPAKAEKPQKPEQPDFPATPAALAHDVKPSGLGQPVLSGRSERADEKLQKKLQKRTEKKSGGPKLKVAGSADAPPAALSPGDRVEAACLALIGPQIRTMLMTSVPVALATIAALWSTTDQGPLFLWIGLTMVSAVVLAFVSRFDPVLDVPAAIRGRRNEITAACAVFGLGWAVGAGLTFGSVIDTQRRLLLLVATAGVLAAMSLATQLSKHAAFALLIPAGLGVCGRFLFGTTFERTTAIVALIVFAAHARHYLDANANQVTLVRNRMENELLSRKLKNSIEMRMLAETELARVTEDIHSDSERDDITGVKNRAAFRETLGTMWQNADAGFDPFSLVLLDIDQYDQIADQHGPEVANDLLRQVAGMIDHALRTDDMVARLGNSQFGLLLNNALTDGALICMERIRRKIATTPFDAGQPLLVSISIAVVTWERGVGLRQIFSAADETLKNARAEGTNQLKVWVNEQSSQMKIPSAVEV